MGFFVGLSFLPAHTWRAKWQSWSATWCLCIFLISVLGSSECPKQQHTRGKPPQHVFQQQYALVWRTCDLSSLTLIYFPRHYTLCFERRMGESVKQTRAVRSYILGTELVYFHRHFWDGAACKIDYSDTGPCSALQFGAQRFNSAVLMNKVHMR